MKKRIGSGVLALCLLLALLPGSVWAAEGDMPAGGTPSVATDENSLRQLLEKKTPNIQLKNGENFELTTTTGQLTIPENYAVTLDLNGSHIDVRIPVGIIVKGSLTVVDSTAKEEELIVNDVNDKKPVPYQFGSINTGNDEAKRDAIHVQNGGNFVLQSGTVSATNIAIAVEAGSTATIDGGYVEAQESALVVLGNDAKANINGGILLSKDNATVAGNGLPQYAGTTINMTGGTLVSKITTTGYIPCGIYHPQKGTLNITGGEIRAPGGVGILMRGGSLNVGDNMTADKFDVDSTEGIKGKVGDASREIEAGDIIAMDRQDGYYDGANVKVTLTKAADSVEELHPTAYHPEGLDLLWTESDDTTIYTIGKKTTTAHTVTFNLNYAGAPAPTTAEVNNGGKVTKPADPTRTGHTFGGWYEEAACTTAWNFDTNTVTGNITLYAKWTPVKKNYTITLNPAGGTLPADQPSTLTTNDDGKLATLPKEPTRTDYKFLRWTTSTGTEVTTDLVFNSNTTIYAQWTKADGSADDQTYTISFDLNYPDAPAAPAAISTDLNHKLPQPLPTVTREGYTFDGWYTEDVVKVSNDTLFYASVTLKAQWTKLSDTPKTFTITLDANGGTLSGAATVTTNAGGKLDNLPAAPTREGYSFDGWFTAASGGKKVDLQSTFEKDSTIYAHWTKNGGTPSDEDEYRIYAPSSVTGGRLYVSHRTATPGTRVTIELRPWSDYELDWLSVVNLDTDRELRLTERYTDEYTFTMPSSDVEVDVSYTDRYYNNYYGGTYYVREVVPAEPKPVKWYYSNGSIVHVTDGMVPYGGQLTRDMLLSVLYNMDPARSGDPTIWAADKGIIPDIYISVLWGVDKPITREQTAMILYCFAQHMGYNTAPTTSLTGYADYRQISDAARPAVAWAKAAGLIAGTSPNTLSPGAVLTCGQANAILARFTANVARTW